MENPSYDISLTLNKSELPDESALIENLIKNNNLGTFLYTVANDIVEGRYNLEAGHTRIILNQLIETVGSIFSTVSSMDSNIQDVTGVLNSHTGLLSKLKEVSAVALQAEQQTAITVEEPTKKISKEDIQKEYEQIAAVESLVMSYTAGDEGNDGIAISSDMEDIFGDMDMDS